MSAKTLVLIVAALVHSTAAVAGKPADDCLVVLERNFAALNDENLKNLMATIAPSCPHYAAATLYNEADAMFKETDVHVSLGDYQFLGVRGPFAYARVVQYTYVTNRDGEPTPYRQASKLMPANEAVAYVQIFRRERGKWYIWTSQDEQAIAKTESTQPCPNGRCQPFVTIQLD